MQIQLNSRFSRNSMRKLFVSVLAMLPLFAASQPSPERLKMFYVNYTEFESQAQKYPDLKFDPAVQKSGLFTSYINKLIVPDDFESQKKYPALIIMPSCAGVAVNLETVKQWVQMANKNGIIAYSLETLRDKKINCAVPQDPGLGRIAKDVLDTVKELNNLPFIDSRNIFVIGESLGAMGALVAGSDSYAERLSPNTPRLNSAISIYGRTMAPLKRSGADKDAYILDRGTNTPILFLAGESDTETPPEDDLETNEAFKLKKNNNFEFHVLKGATHCWNCKSLNGFTKRGNNGKMVTYIYDKEISDKAEELTLDFIKRNLKR